MIRTLDSLVYMLENDKILEMRYTSIKVEHMIQVLMILALEIPQLLHLFSFQHEHFDSDIEFRIWKFNAIGMYT